MARALLTSRRPARALALALGALVSGGVTGCAEDLVLEVHAPLLVFNTYPANGATLARGDLGELAVTFSDDLGAAETARLQARAHLTLADRDGALRLVRSDMTNVAYDDVTFTLRVVLDQALRDALRPGDYTMTIGQGFQRFDGVPLPTDYVVVFRLESR